MQKNTFRHDRDFSLYNLPNIVHTVDTTSYRSLKARVLNNKKQ